mmetsp:Transcript_121679/g.378309  ORF Transcript_121679/g.378309 Transcript_121679/m.378309 type:complete len:173 (+) Transcript_121679:109-627(+)
MGVLGAWRLALRAVTALAAAAGGALAGLALLPQGSPGAGEPAFVAPRGVRLLRPADSPRLPEPLCADPNQWGLLRPLEQKKMPSKPPFIAVSLLNKITRMNKEGIKETIQVWNRHSTIIPAMIGHTIALHNGREFVPVTVTEGMVGYKLEDFVPTHTFKGHPKQAKITKFSR